MQQKVVINGKKVSLGDNDFISSGGQGSVFHYNGKAIKIYHDKKNMIPIQKINELSVLKKDNILGPRDLVLNNDGEIIGYTMPFVYRTHPLCQLFVKNFKEDNGIKEKDIADLIKIIQETISYIHSHDVVMVDGNEMNYLVSSDFITPYFLDVDSWITPNFPKATFIMDSIRDRLIKNNNYNKLSDWFAFAIIATQLYLGIHPYRGRHPEYKPAQWQKRMDDGISIFDPNVKLPPSVNDWNVIPKKHLDWLKTVFVKNERCEPPLPDGVSILATAITRVVRSIGRFEVQEWFTLDEKPRMISKAGEFVYFIGKDKVVNDYKVNEKIINCQGYLRVFPTLTNKGNVVFCAWSHYKDVILKSSEDKKVFGCQKDVEAMFTRDNRVYTLSKGKVFGVDITEISDSKLVFNPYLIGRVLENSGKVYNGIIVQNIMGKTWIMIPYSEKKNFFKHIPELDDYRITDAKSEKNIAIFFGEKDGVHHRIILMFDFNFINYSVRVHNDVPKEAINFTTLPNGVCVLAVENGEVEVFINNNKVNRYEQCPFDSTMKLFNTEKEVCFVQNNTVYKVKMN